MGSQMPVHHAFYQGLHQQATNHLIQLCNSHYATSSVAVNERNGAVSCIDEINSLIERYNMRFNIPADYGIINYRAFLYGWDRFEDADKTKCRLEAFCKRKGYMRGWSCLPPVHDYKYFSNGNKHTACNTVTSWLRLIWDLLTERYQHVDDIQQMLLAYMQGPKPREDPSLANFDILRVLQTMTEMDKLLQANKINEYGRLREILHHQCEFEGFPSGWIEATPGEADA